MALRVAELREKYAAALPPSKFRERLLLGAKEYRRIAAEDEAEVIGPIPR
jgi:hypothetical protein